MSTKPEKTEDVKTTKETKQKPENKNLFVVSYDPTNRLVRIGALAIPTWILSFATGVILTLAIEALINHR